MEETISNCDQKLFIWGLKNLPIFKASCFENLTKEPTGGQILTFWSCCYIIFQFWFTDSNMFRFYTISLNYKTNWERPIVERAYNSFFFVKSTQLFNMLATFSWAKVDWLLFQYAINCSSCRINWRNNISKSDDDKNVKKRLCGLKVITPIYVVPYLFNLWFLSS